jgi:hypothetical protein
MTCDVLAGRGLYVDRAVAVKQDRVQAAHEHR